MVVGEDQTVGGVNDAGANPPSRPPADRDGPAMLTTLE